MQRNQETIKWRRRQRRRSGDGRATKLQVLSCKLEQTRRHSREPNQWPAPKGQHKEQINKSAASSNLVLLPLLQLLIAAAVCNQLQAATLSFALKVGINVPELVKLNDAFWLNCSHKTPMDHTPPLVDGQQQQSSANEIYAIKWYKDEEEFYRYLPNAEPKVSIYETNGIQLDQSKSFEGNVFLTKAEVNTEGNYRCEILSEAPVFETVRKSKHLKVYVRGPRIEILDSNGRPKSPKAQEISYAVGDKIELLCNSAPSKPAAKLRWYLNDQELVLPAAATAGATVNNATIAKDGRSSQRNTDAYSFIPIVSSNNHAISKYNVRMTPIEYRKHYKGIYSSHSGLSLVLQQDDLISSKISFKCLASMRQELPVASKQLIVLTPQLLAATTNNRQRTRRRSKRATLVNGHLMEVKVQDDRSSRQQGRDQVAAANQSQDAGERPPSSRHRVQYNRRLGAPGTQKHSNQVAQQQQANQNRFANSELISGNEASGSTVLNSIESKNQLAYIYEDADSTLGPSIINSPATLEQYLSLGGGGDGTMGATNPALLDASNYTHQTNAATNNLTPSPLEYNQADNLDHVQVLRDRLARQRSLPTMGGQLGASGHPTHSSGATYYGHKRLFGPNSLVKSPMYLDELDPLRPVINWPPLDSGKLLLLPPANTIVAIPTLSNRQQQQQQINANEFRFVLPPTNRHLESQLQQQRPTANSSGQDESNNIGQLMLERLVENLTCTCGDGSIDTKMGWIINDLNINSRGIRYHPARNSGPDNRQSWLTIGLQTVASPTTSVAVLQSILSDYYKKPPSPTPPSSSSEQANNYAKRAASARSSSPSIGHPHQPPGAQTIVDTDPSEHIRFTCQAIHSMLLYSSSEMITFDFNPLPPAESGLNPLDKLPSLQSNVIQATSASQSSGASARTFALPAAPLLTILSMLFITQTILLLMFFKTI